MSQTSEELIFFLPSLSDSLNFELGLSDNKQHLQTLDACSHKRCGFHGSWLVL